MGFESSESVLASWQDHHNGNDHHSSHRQTNSDSSTHLLADARLGFKHVHDTTPSASNFSLASFVEKHEQDHATDWAPGRAEWLIIATMAITSLITALDTTILVPVLPTLAVDLHGTAAETFWAGTSFLLASAVFQPVIAAISDVFGRREVLLPAVLLFFVGSVVCGWAHNFATLLVGRVIQGIGGGGIITMAQIVFADMIPLRQRPKYFAIVLLAWGLGTILGPLLGGTFVQTTTWRWCFWLNLPICGISMVMIFLFVNLKIPKSSFREKFLRVDWVGAFFFISSMTSFLIAISWGGIQFSWTSWHTLVPLIAGAVGLLVITFGWERYYATEPFLIKSLFQNSSAIFSYACALLQGGLLLMALYYIPFYFTAVRHAGPLHSGVNLLPAVTCLLPGSAIVSALITRLGHYRLFIWIGWIVGTIGFGLLILLDQSTPTAVWAAALSIIGLGMGMVLSSVNFSVQACVEARDAGRAAAMYAFMRNVGMSLGVAVGGTVFQNFMKSELRAQGLPEEIAVVAEAFVQQLWDPSVTPEAEFVKLQAAYVHGFKGVFETLTLLSGVALLLSLFIKHFNLDKLLESKFTVKH